MSRITINQLRSLIAEEIQSIVEVEKKGVKKEREDSLDSQIDKYFIDYESESKSSKLESKDFRRTMKRFLSEAKNDEKKLTSEDINVENFVNNVMRLIENYDVLLEVRNTILRRAVNFLMDGYEPDVVSNFKESLLDIHGIEIGKSQFEAEDEKYQAPPADRAGPSPGGA